MGLWELLTYLECYLARPLEATMVAIVVKKIKEYFWGPQGKDFIDEHMSGYANNYGIHCPNCETIKWFPISMPQVPVFEADKLDKKALQKKIKDIEKQIKEIEAKEKKEEKKAKTKEKERSL